MRKLSEGRACAVAFLASCVSLLTIVGVALVIGNVSSGKKSRVTESRKVDFEVANRGRQIFVKHCTECHGYDARGDEGSDLHNLRTGDVLIRQVITGGIKGVMPAYGKVLNDADVRALTGYLRTLRN
jgi:mono/diheme cytochrome c family protein